MITALASFFYNIRGHISQMHQLVKIPAMLREIANEMCIRDSSYSVYRSAPDYWKANASKPWLAADYI